MKADLIKLRKIACRESQSFLHDCDNIDDVWNKCTNGDWMLWFIAVCDPKKAHEIATKVTTDFLAKDPTNHIMKVQQHICRLSLQESAPDKLCQVIQPMIKKNSADLIRSLHPKTPKLP